MYVCNYMYVAICFMNDFVATLLTHSGSFERRLAMAASLYHLRLAVLLLE